MRKYFFTITKGVLYGLAILFTVSLFNAGYRPSLEQISNLPKLGTREQNKDASEHPVVRLVDEDGQFFCTAVVFDPNYAVTAAHCLTEKGRLRQTEFVIHTREGKNTKIKAKAAGLNNRMDFGIVLGNFSSFLMAKIDSYTTPLLTSRGPFTTCGYAYGQRLMTCNPLIPRGNFGFHVFGIGAVFPGMSGGPVIDMSTNTVVGVNSASYDGGVIVVPLTGLFGAFDLEP
ncbi:MAG: serine protease [Magnetococcus sp. WYHC-3]